jgi:hypothetical protein
MEAILELASLELKTFGMRAQHLTTIPDTKFKGI